MTLRDRQSGLPLDLFVTQGPAFSKLARGGMQPALP
jgi:hypothetical protein